MRPGAVLLALTNTDGTNGTNGTDGIAEPSCLIELQGRPVVLNLLEQLQSLDVDPCMVITRSYAQDAVHASLGDSFGTTQLTVPVEGGAAAFTVIAAAAEQADSSSQSLVVLPAASVAHTTLLSWLTTGDQSSSAALISPVEVPGAPVHVVGDRVSDASSPEHRIDSMNGWSVGAIRVGSNDLDDLASTARHIAGTLERHELTDSNPIELLLVGLVRTGVAVRAVDPRGLSWVAVESTDQGIAAGQSVMNAAHEAKLRLDASVKQNDNFWTTFFISPWTKHVARRFDGWGISPNTVTVVGFLLTIVAAVLLAVDETAAVVAGALIVQLSFAGDCIDGQLARYGRHMSEFGAWLDWNLDRMKEPALIVGLTVGASHSEPASWLLGSLALALLAVRGLLVQSYTMNEVMAEPRRADLLASGSNPTPDLLPPWTERRGGLVHWVRYVVIGFPYADRLAAITITAIIGGPYLSLIVFVGWNAFALVAQTIGRLWKNAAKGNICDPLRDDGPLAGALRSILPTQPAVLTVIGVAISLTLLMVWPEQLWLPIVVVIPLIALTAAPTGPPFWLGPPLTAATELGVLVAASAASTGREDWTIVAAAAVVVVVRAGAVTKQRFGIGRSVSGVGWELRTAALCAAWSLDMIALGALFVILTGAAQYAIDTGRSARELRSDPAATD